MPQKGGNTVFEEIKAKLLALWEGIDGEAKAELQQLLADAEAEEAALKEQLAPLLAQLETDLKAAAATLAPEVQAAIAAILEKFLSAALPLLGKAPAEGM
jgi:hypothetical protein